MNFTLITLAVVSIVGLTKLLTWLLGKPRRLAKLRKRRDDIIEAMRKAAVKCDDIALARLERELMLVRKNITYLTGE